MNVLNLSSSWIASPLTVFLKHGQLDFSNASDSIYEYQHDFLRDGGRGSHSLCFSSWSSFIMIIKCYRGECYKCIVFHKRHLNVLQYKESERQSFAYSKKLSALLSSSSSLKSLSKSLYVNPLHIKKTYQHHFHHRHHWNHYQSLLTPLYQAQRAYQKLPCHHSAQQFLETPLSTPSLEFKPSPSGFGWTYLWKSFPLYTLFRVQTQPIRFWLN